MNCHPRILCIAKLSFKNDSETSDFCLLYKNLEKNVTAIFTKTMKLTGQWQIYNFSQSYQTADIAG